MAIKNSKALTQAEIARKAGISQSAVSAILSGSSALSVGDETRDKVLELARKYGYVARRSMPRGVGQAADKRQTALIVENEAPRVETNEPWLSEAYQTFMGKILSASSRYLLNYDIALSVYQLSDHKRFTQWLAESAVAGVLWHATDSDSALMHWVASRFPMVLLNREWKSSVTVDTVSVDQEKNIYIAADHLCAMGHRKICIFGHNPKNSFYRRRMAAYRLFIEERGLRNYTEFQEIPDALDASSLDKVHNIIQVWKQLGSEAPTAIITNDVFALQLLREGQKAGIRIPEDLSVIGIDNTSPCSLVNPPLTSMEEPLDEMCKTAVDLLMRRKLNPTEPAHAVQIAPRLIVRESVRNLRGDTQSSPLHQLTS